jgi:hypothetical protein
LDIILPLRLIWSEDSAIIGHKSVHFSFNIGSLSPNSATAGEKFGLVSKFGEQGVTSVIPDNQRLVDFVRLIYGINCFLDVPEAARMLVVKQPED